MVCLALTTQGEAAAAAFVAALTEQRTGAAGGPHGAG
jgi:hypothetical protein